MINVFCPLTEDYTVRLRFDLDRVKVVAGNLWARKRGHKATVEIDGHRFRVFGASCGLPHCMCDALIRLEA